MMKKRNLDTCIEELINYSIKCGLIKKEDRIYSRSRLMSLFGVDSFENHTVTEERELSEILGDLCDIAYEMGLTEGNTVVYRDLFDTRVMGELTPRPSEIIKRFSGLYEESPELATDYFYKLSRDSNYIRVDRIKRDLKWTFDSEYGAMDISVNLSKPEKDPVAIAAAKLLPQTDYPKCALCRENEGFRGTLSKAARQTLRQIPFKMAGDNWYLQYSPYVYYNEHCIALSEEHKPMKIDRSSFEKLLGFVTEFPHYFIGSNADLKIVGGSILSHDHMQGGRYTFAMEKADIDTQINFTRYPTITAGIVKWPMSVIRLTSTDREALVNLSDDILKVWREYTDKEAFVFAETDGEPHNTITPIARRRNGAYEIDLVLRNNITTEEHPLGVYHPHAEHHNIKKENIGLIEVMGLAILPARLKDEIDDMKSAILAKEDFSNKESTAKHKYWFENFKNEYAFTPENTEEILKKEIGKTFVRVLTDAGVFKNTPEGKAAFLKFVKKVNGEP